MSDELQESFSTVLRPPPSSANPLSQNSSRYDSRHTNSAPPRPLSVLLLDQDGHFSQKVAVCLGQIKGLKLHVISNRAWVPIRLSRHLSSFHSLRPRATDTERLETVLNVIKKTSCNVLLPVVESGSRFIATHKTVLENHLAIAPLPPPSSLEVGLDKRLLRDFLLERGLPHPATVSLHSIAQAESEAATLAFPVLFKPAASSGGTGIQIFEDPASLVSFLRARWQPQIPALLQSCVHGHDVDCSVLCKDGRILAHTIQLSLFPRRNRFGIDDALEFVSDKETLDVTASLVSALNWSGVAHVDLRWDSRDNKVKILDLNGRYWTTLLGSLAAGVNFPYLSCLAGLGITFAPPAPLTRRFFTAEAAPRHFGRRFLGSAAPHITFRDSGLPYAFNDPGPRVFNIAKRAVVALTEKFKQLPRSPQLW